MYKALSKYYDLFMRDVDYSKWADFVCSFLTEYKDGVDLACGSGKFTLELKKRGYSVYGVDNSQAMLNCAVQNALLARQTISFVRGNMETFKFIRPPQFVTIICDGINYLKNPLTAFKNIFAALVKGGALVFDISSEYKLRHILADYTFSDTHGDTTYIWKSVLNNSKRCLEHELTFFERDGELFKKSCEEQVQYIHSTESILEMLACVGFKTEAMSIDKNAKIKELSDNDERVYFVAKKV